MTTTPGEPTRPHGEDQDREELREQARARVDEMPAETALGNADPAGGDDSDPKTFTGDGNS